LLRVCAGFTGARLAEFLGHNDAELDLFSVTAGGETTRNNLSGLLFGVSAWPLVG
jgi:hypothetical protein